MSDEIRVEVAGRIATVTLDRPPVNALTMAAYRRMAEVFQELSRRDDALVVVLVSALDKVFCAGADIKELLGFAQSGQLAIDEQRQVLARTMFDAIRTCRQPVIAALNGPALGTGAVIAACADVRYASERATIGLPEINVGRCGGGRHLMRLLPQGKLREMYFTGRPLESAEAYRLGLFDRLLPAGQERAAAFELAREIATKSPLALRLAKEALNACEALPVSEGYAVEQGYTIQLGRSDDAREAMQAFAERRPPLWSGR